MKLTHRLTIATALSATLATALIAGPTMASPSDENKPTGPGTANGDKSTACRADWTAAAILDTDILAHHPELVNPADITRNADNSINKIATGSNNGYTSKISTNFNTETYKAPGMFEANHWIAGSTQNWRFPVATKNKLAAGTTITVDLPDDMTNTSFIGKLETRAGLNAYMQAWGPREAEYTWNDGDFTATLTDAAKNIWTVTLNKGLDAGTGTIFQFTGTFPEGAESSTASANLVGAQYPANGQVCGDLPTPGTPELTPCQATTVDRTVWSPYSRDIDERSKYTGSWGSEEPAWGEANADAGASGPTLRTCSSEATSEGRPGSVSRAGVFVTIAVAMRTAAARWPPAGASDSSKPAASRSVASERAPAACSASASSERLGRATRWLTS